ncbi:MFS transporter [Oscillatoria sp. CS-180]|uniref:MFS transporter n=1 Tax=Oscillatoria sp. CS-180 TaxID=3021720 RepID=UPI002331089A|nr:MFS transporter [Oscillatoria sp. CS-180]MDB9528897.1 MFS transporter [Oscillatoria sp. CS-180]
MRNSIVFRLPKLIAIALHRLNQSRVLQPNFPFQPAQFPIFYGWVILIATTVGILMSIPGQTAGVSVFTDPLLRATGLSRLALSNAYLIGTLTSGLFLPLGGVFIDRFGARIVVIVSSIGLGLTLVYLSVSDRLAQEISAIFSLNSSLPVAFVLLCIGFVSLRFSGQGMLTLVSRTTVGKWFDRRRGIASGTAGVFLSFGFSAAPLLLSFFIDGLGWRGAWLSLAALVSIGMGSLGWLLYRDNPEECGLLMDGRLASLAEVPASSTVEPTEHSQDIPAQPRSFSTAHDFTRSEALKTLAFWSVTLALASQALTITGITFHIVDIGAAAGLPEKQTVAIFLPIGVIATVTGYLIGIASDRIRLKVLFMAMMLFEAMGVASMAHLDNPLLRLLTILGLGFTGGCFGTLSTVTMPRYFGRRHLGAIAGVEMMTLVIASAIGPSLLAMFNEFFGNYRMGLYVCAGIPLTVLLLLIPSSNPQR